MLRSFVSWRQRGTWRGPVLAVASPIAEELVVHNPRAEESGEVSAAARATGADNNDEQDDGIYPMKPL